MGYIGVVSEGYITGKNLVHFLKIPKKSQKPRITYGDTLLSHLRIAIEIPFVNFVCIVALSIICLVFSFLFSILYSSRLSTSMLKATFDSGMHYVLWDVWVFEFTVLFPIDTYKSTRNIEYAS